MPSKSSLNKNLHHATFDWLKNGEVIRVNFTPPLSHKLAKKIESKDVPYFKRKHTAEKLIKGLLHEARLFGLDQATQEQSIANHYAKYEKIGIKVITAVEQEVIAQQKTAEAFSSIPSELELPHLPSKKNEIQATFPYNDASLDKFWWTEGKLHRVYDQWKPDQI